ncbi:glutathione S-transferase C-terminal domain-containing protein [Hyphomonas sp.]|uniref:glutathione S-transferase C-terminal domain-containing protein n=1 Tax=Hyphomonas sp. TaxID=87 RepID=UPI0025BA9F69|nr:glutathione S-transferase C-terminal domain-containing protein [Hyphomonas sp.]MBI1400352.1 glutathione S-transferase family protein [Hyphomonas sp.]
MSRYDIYGALGSPYSMKVRAALRAKRLLHTWTGMTAEDRTHVMPNVKAQVIPVIRKPDGIWTNDSTPFLLSLEGEGRALVPADPALRFVCLLIEDMADEWFMKAMFHYRWAYAEDAEWCANWLMYDSLPNAGRAGVEKMAATIRERQISRMALVGCTPATAPIIEASWKRTCRMLEDMATGPTRFLFGDRISLADLALYGQLKVMSVDPTPMAWLRSDVPYLYRWLDLADDASGLDGEWLSPDAALTTVPVKALLAQAGDTYLPFLKANADALQAGQETFDLTLEGRPYTQGVFKYQAKCLETLRADWKALGENDRASIRALIGEGAAILD